MTIRSLLISLITCTFLFNLATYGVEDRLKVVATTTQAADIMHILSADLDSIQAHRAYGRRASIHICISRPNPTSSL